MFPPVQCPVDSDTLLRLYDEAGTLWVLRATLAKEYGCITSTDTIRRWLTSNKTCRVCGKRTPGKLDCSRKCQNVWYHRHMKKKERPERPEVFVPIVDLRYFQNMVVDEKSADRFSEDIRAGRIEYVSKTNLKRRYPQNV
jgi:predicted nucleic acid-binding Zn ribbon protein